MNKLQIVVRVTAADNNQSGSLSSQSPIALALKRHLINADVATCSNAVGISCTSRSIEGIFKLPKRAIAFLKACELGIWNKSNPFEFTLTVQTGK